MSGWENFFVGELGASAAIVLLIFGASGLYWIVAAILLSFLSAFLDAWVLTIEINR